MLLVLWPLTSLVDKRARVPIMYATFKGRLEKLGRTLDLKKRDGTALRLIPSVLRYPPFLGFFPALFRGYL